MIRPSSVLIGQLSRDVERRGAGAIARSFHGCGSPVSVTGSFLKTRPSPSNSHSGLTPCCSVNLAIS